MVILVCARYVSMCWIDFTISAISCIRILALPIFFNLFLMLLLLVPLYHILDSLTSCRIWAPFNTWQQKKYDIQFQIISQLEAGEYLYFHIYLDLIEKESVDSMKYCITLIWIFDFNLIFVIQFHSTQNRFAIVYKMKLDEFCDNLFIVIVSVRQRYFN